jgi:hypothetical protein
MTDAGEKMSAIKENSKQVVCGRSVRLMDLTHKITCVTSDGHNDLTMISVREDARCVCRNGLTNRRQAQFATSHHRRHAFDTDVLADYPFNSCFPSSVLHI